MEFLKQVLKNPWIGKKFHGILKNPWIFLVSLCSQNPVPNNKGGVRL
jgi:hypothetical protein